MADYPIDRVMAFDKQAYQAIDKLLAEERIKRDPNLDYTCAMYDEEGEIIATGSCFANSLRCLAVSSAHQGEGLMNAIVTHLINGQYERGNPHIFLYTKCNSAKFFQSLGFYEIARIEGKLVFMENQRKGFANYLANLAACVPELKPEQKIAAIVMNANPFTLGHQYLVEKASRENDVVYLFVVSEDKSLVPFAVRKQLVQVGVAHLPNVHCLDTDSYMISSATFPSYFQENENAVIESNVLLDLQIFSQIANALGIQRRYVGDEPFSRVTNLYNQIMQAELPKVGIECVVVPRKANEGQAISASSVRAAIQAGDFAKVSAMLPESSYQFLLSAEGQKIVQRIQQAENVIHY